MNPLVTVIASLFIAIFITAAGRLLATHTGERHYHTTPLHCFIAGLGVWYLWFLLFSSFRTVSVDVIVTTFGVSMLLLFIALPKIMHIKIEMEHFWTLMVASLLILAPTLIFLGSDQPTFGREFAEDMRIADYLFSLNSLPEQAEVIGRNIVGLEKPVALASMSAPVSVLVQHFNPAVFACLSFFLLAVTTGGLVRSAQINVRWSNLPLVASGGLIAITLLNPFLQVAGLFSAYRELWVAATFFCALMPLISSRSLPHGWEVVPTAFVLIFLVGLAPEGIYLAGMVAVLWLLRLIVEQSENFVASLFGIVVLVTAPLIAFYLWYGGGSFVVPVDVAMPEVITNQIYYYLALVAGTLIGVVTIWRSVVALFAGKGGKGLVIERSWYTVPALIFIFGVASSFWLGGHWGLKFVLYSQFIFLLPVWLFAGKFYQHMWVQKFAFKQPWGVGLFLALIVIGLQSTYRNYTNMNPSYPLAHIQQVGAHFSNEVRGAFGATVAVVDETNTQFYADALGYAISPALAKTVAVEPVEGMGKYGLHETLYSNKVKYLWVHRATDKTQKLLGIELDKGYSYLFKVSDFSFKLVTIYPHPHYQ